MQDHLDYKPAPMAIKKSDLYSSIWASCDELRGGMDASQYKDYVLFMLFIKYITDKYGNSNDFAPPVTIPKGASFKDMIALKGKSDIGDKINTQIIQPLIDANARLARSDFPDFNDPNKLGEGQAMVDRLTNLIGIFQKPELGDIVVAVTRKDIKHVHLSVHPPTGRVTLVAPRATRMEVARAFAISKLSWIRDQQAKLIGQARETARQFVERESHYLWGRRYLLSVVERDTTLRPAQSPKDHPDGAPRQHRREARRNHPRVAQITSACCRAATHQEVGGEARRDGFRLLSPAHEDEVGRLQPPGAAHPAQHPTREEAERPAGVRRRPRDGTPAGADA